MQSTGLYYVIGGMTDLQVISDTIKQLVRPFERSVRITYIGAAASNDEAYRDSFTRTACNDNNCTVTDLHLDVDAPVSEVEVDGAFQEADIVFFNGGDYLRLSEVFRFFELKQKCLSAFERGASVGGLCSGGMIMGAAAVFPRVPDGILSSADGSALIPGVVFAPYVGDRAYPTMVSTLENTAYARNLTGVGVPINQTLTWQPQAGFQCIFSDRPGPVIMKPD